MRKNIAQKLKKEIINQVRKCIGPIAKPAKIYFVNDLPKTRSGKIMRRILRGLVKGELIGDLTTLTNPESVREIKRMLEKD